MFADKNREMQRYVQRAALELIKQIEARGGDMLEEAHVALPDGMDEAAYKTALTERLAEAGIDFVTLRTKPMTDAEGPLVLAARFQKGWAE